eukprot:4790118-Pyramimonas_sp.AAC.1
MNCPRGRFLQNWKRSQPRHDAQQKCVGFLLGWCLPRAVKLKNPDLIRLDNLSLKVARVYGNSCPVRATN